MKKGIVAGSLMLTALLLAGCGTADGASSQADVMKADETATSSQQPSQEAPKGGMNMKPATPAPLTEAQSQQLAAGEADHEPTTLTFDVNGGNFYFSPSEIHVKKGDTVKINFINDGGMHNLVLDEFKLTMDAFKSPGNKEVEFIADQAGTFEYYCSVGSHRKMGMKGNLIVEE